MKKATVNLKTESGISLEELKVISGLGNCIHLPIQCPWDALGLKNQHAMLTIIEQQCMILSVISDQ